MCCWDVQVCSGKKNNDHVCYVDIAQVSHGPMATDASPEVEMLLAYEQPALETATAAEYNSTFHIGSYLTDLLFQHYQYDHSCRKTASGHRHTIDRGR